MTQPPLVIDWLSDTTLKDLLARPDLCQELFGRTALLETLIDKLAATPREAQWYRPAGIWMDYRWVATGGFKGPPQQGRVEIGYRVLPAYRRRGLATALIHWLCQRAASADLTAVLAVTAADNQPSQAVLNRLGFTQHGQFLNDQNEPLLRWQLKLDPAQR
ncbi:GNAT family N-acetyltransferase [Saccharospirillum mangrovi]|uniref:GNAT family N-acetyltransferase n=1 Tax=Saccharospirillum mangrovi TaxID=2161747 RepID=UPI000D34D2E2|nr:GNAT family N-acetyltransferase [Saccharospirillum mangrovi]